MMEGVVRDRLAGRIRDEVSRAEARRARYVSREFVARDSDGKPRSVGDTSHLSEQYFPVGTKAETLGGFSGTIEARGLNVVYGFEVWIPPISPSPRYAGLFHYLSGICGWHNPLFPLSCAAIRLVQKRLLVLTICREVLDSDQDELWVQSIDVCGPRSLYPIVREAGDDIGLFKGLASRKLLASAYGLTRHPTKGVWGRRAHVLEHLGIVIDSVRGIFGVAAQKLKALSGMARALLKQARCSRTLVVSKELENFIGKAQSLRLAAPETAFSAQSPLRRYPVRDFPARDSKSV